MLSILFFERDVGAYITMADAPSNSSTTLRVQDVSLFATISESQTSHGILHQDYAQYHRYCTNRLDRLRHHKDARSHLVNNPKYITAAEASLTDSKSSETKINKKAASAKQRRHGYGARAAPSPSLLSTTHKAEEARDANALNDDPMHSNDDSTIGDSAWKNLYAYTLLYQSERCWAQACTMQQHQQQSGNSSAYNHKHCLQRLKKAGKWSAQLFDWMKQVVDAAANVPSESKNDVKMSTLLTECESYSSWMQGNVALERADYKSALEAYQRSMSLLLQLATDHSSASDAIVLADVWRTRAETVLKPLVRYCAYQAKVALTDDNSFIGDAALSATDGAAIVVSFGGKDMALDSYKNLVVLYLKLEEAMNRLFVIEEGLDKGNIEFSDDQFLQLSCDLDDVLDQVKTEQAYYASLPTGPAVTAKREELDMLLAYFQYLKLQIWRLQQEERIVTMTDDAALVHAYDILQQNVQAMLELLPSAASASLSANEHEDDPHWLEAQAHVLRIRAFRCYYLARLYENALDGTPQQCLALLAQASKLLKRAREEISACEDIMKGARAYLVGLDELQQHITLMTCRVEATQYLDQESVHYGRQTNRPLWLRLDDFDAGAVLCDSPPLPIIMPFKPTFFDIAYQHVGAGEFPIEELQDFIEAHEPKRASLFTWFRS
ncbi:hypothetical protein MPSEU_000536600 [Mayamaea pseudoterrestris]|nr:hypothetical protein MPSEU_000536600 [Mayamaea pseudoterrestris]